MRGGSSDPRGRSSVLYSHNASGSADFQDAPGSVDFLSTTAALGQISREAPQGHHALYSSPEQIRRLLMLEAERRFAALSGEDDGIWQLGVMTHLDLSADNRPAVEQTIRSLGGAAAVRHAGGGGEGGSPA